MTEEEEKEQEDENKRIRPGEQARGQKNVKHGEDRCFQNGPPATTTFEATSHILQCDIKFFFSFIILN